MIKEIPFDKIIQTAMRFGAEYAEVFSELRRTTTVVCDNRKLENASIFFDKGVGIRVIVDGRVTYGSTNDLTRRNLTALAKSVTEAACSKKREVGEIALREKKTDSIATVSKHPYGIELDKKCDIVMRANDVAWGTGKQIRQVKVMYRDVVRRILVASSDGMFASDEQVGTVFLAQAVASDGVHLQTGQETSGGSVGFEMFDETPPEETSEKAAKRAIKVLTAREAPSGTMAAIISSEAGGTMIHEAVGHGLEADLAHEGHSIYAGKIGEKVASNLITVIDDATIPGKRGSFTFDDEGTPAKKTVLIKNGTLKAYMSDYLRARQNGVESTGNGRRQSYEYPPIVRMTNTIIAPGRDNPTSILMETPSGLFVKRMGGGQVNTINGDFIFDVQEGYLIENGKIGEPVRGATLIGNGPKILKEIDRVGSDLGFSIGTCGKEGQEAPVSCGMPTLRIPQIVVGGTK